MKNTRRKVNLYILSLGLLFIFIIIITFSFPNNLSDLKTTDGWISMLKKNVVTILSLSMIGYSFYAYRSFVYDLKGTTDLPFLIKRVESVDYEHLTFLATYVVPLISFNFDSLRQLLVLALLLVVMGAIYVKTDLFYANPSLALLGFRIFRVDGDFKDGERNGIIVICREKLKLGEHIAYIRLDDNIYFAKGVAK